MSLSTCATLPKDGSRVAARWKMVLELEGDAAADACKNLGQAIVACVRASTQLPSGSDHEYFTTFAEFRAAVGSGAAGGKKKGGCGEGGGAGGRALGLIERVIGAKSVAKDSDEAFDRVVDFVDERLERVDTLIDEMLGRSSAVAAVPAKGAVAGAGAGKGGRKARGMPQNLDMPKPQLKFADPVDNSADNPFVPIVWPKIHPAPPGSAPAPGGSKHPYAAEIAAIDYLPHMLAPPTDPPPPPSASDAGKATMEKTPFTWVDTIEGLQEAKGHLEAQGEVAVDLEHHSVRTFQGITCLMQVRMMMKPRPWNPEPQTLNPKPQTLNPKPGWSQVSSRSRDFIIDTIALRSYMHLLLGVFTNPAITKVFHGADSDVKWLQRDFGLYIVNLFDSGQASRVLG
jgi:exosome complex exonuclease RRP6